MEDLYQYNDYTDYLKDWVSSRPKKGHGVRVKMAQHLGCIPTQITKVFKKEIHLTLDQAAKLISFLELSQPEGQYFFALVEYGRSGSNEMKSLVKERMDELKQKLETKGRFEANKHELSRKDFEIYFEHWYFSAIEMLAVIPKYQTIDSISEHLKLPKKEVLRVLNFLVKANLLQKEENKYIRDLKTTWVDPPSPIFLNKHQLNWRARAINSFDQHDEDIANLTVLLTMSKKDIPRIYDELQKTAADLVKSVKNHPREELRCFTIDFFKI